MRSGYFQRRGLVDLNGTFQIVGQQDDPWFVRHVVKHHWALLSNIEIFPEGHVLLPHQAVAQKVNLHVWSNSSVVLHLDRATEEETINIGIEKPSGDMGVDKLVVRKPGGTILFVHQGGVSFKAIKLQFLVSVSQVPVPVKIRFMNHRCG